MTAWLLLVTLWSGAPQRATPVTYPTLKACERQAEFARLTARVGRYRCAAV